jgi:methionyl-tRNA formyltransferase
MRVGIIGRTGVLLKSAEALREAGHELAFVATCKAELFYDKNDVDFQNYASRLNIPFFNTLDLESKIDSISALKADICISINWLKIIDKSFLSIFPLGILNAHAGDLPRYKGNAAANWAILNFEQEVVLTIHKMVEELDSGPYLLKEYFKIDDKTYIGDIYAWLESSVPNIFTNAMDLVGFKEFIEQDKTIKTLRTYPRNPDDSRINWSWDNKSVLAMIRASSYPFDGAFCFLNGTDLKVNIFKASEFNADFDFCAVPGQVCFKVGELPVVASRNGLIIIEECFISDFSVSESMKYITQSLRNRLT